MRLSDATVVIRPRTTWEAMDLGVLMSQQHRRLLMTSWAIVTLPVYMLLTLLLWDSPSLVVVVFWWLKPAFDRLPLYILSKALFGETPTLKQALRQWPALLKPQLLASLTWRRLSLSRSFLMPVVQLEGLAGEAREQRLRVLLQRNGGAAQWLTIIGVHLETALWFGLMALFYLFVPQQVELEWDWQALFDTTEYGWLWFEHLVNFLYPLVLIVWEPIYVACGFSLYLNRRTILEGWDIELAFRRLRQRLGGVAPVLMLLALMLLPLAPRRGPMRTASAPTARGCSTSPSPAKPPGTASRRSSMRRRSRTRKRSLAIVSAKKPSTPTKRVKPRAGSRHCSNGWAASASNSPRH